MHQLKGQFTHFLLVTMQLVKFQFWMNYSFKQKPSTAPLPSLSENTDINIQPAFSRTEEHGLKQEVVELLSLENKEARSDSSISSI